MPPSATGSDWRFPDDIPGAWSQDDVDNQSHAEQASTALQTEEPRSTTASDGQPRGQQQKRQHYPPRTCRICLDTVLPTFHTNDSSPFPASITSDEIRVTYESPAGEGGRLLRPCKCKGTAKYVHEECLSAWRRQDPLQKRNYWQCPTCHYKYRLQRLTYGSWLSSTFVQLGLTLFIFVMAMFALGFVADPIINLYLDPFETITTAGGPTGSLIFEDEPVTWTEHFVKGLASIGLLGFAKFLLTLSPWHWFRFGSGGGARTTGGTGRERLQQISWITLAIGIVTALYALWRGVRAWSRRTLESASETVMDVPEDVNGVDDDDD
ncbi:Hypothetical protein R9X50_00686500 [Acrodontium crateriforme]|uniref:RING-CH-type domain-containing protein n=1 Tax=Acrodontium crateriforme TaxID=150365 RepID=A0AAQ3MAK7_9PEZI|nr:Hypothetical protein R9X50_00686500 [Acrodontium crateriforme]